MNKYIFGFLILITFGFTSCNQSASSKDASKERKIKNVKSGEHINGLSGDTVYLKKPKAVKNSNDLPNGFYNKKWMRSPSEDKKFDGEVYRPEGFRTLKPMRFTPTFIFKKDKTCQYLKLMPNDAHQMESASWAYNLNKQMRVFVSGDARREMLYDWNVKTAKGNLLVVEPVNVSNK